MKQQKYFNGKKPIYFTKQQVDKHISVAQRMSLMLVMMILYDRYNFSQEELEDVGEAYYVKLANYNNGDYSARQLQEEFMKKTGLEMLI